MSPVEKLPVDADAIDKPIVADVGIIALVPDRWSSRWMVRHHIMARLGRYFHMIWVDPAHQWREMLSSRPPSAKNADTASYPGFDVYTPEFWLPELYRPHWLAQFSLKQRLHRARQLLIQRGCQKIVLYLWRPEFESTLKLIPFDVSCYHLEDEYSFSRVDLPVDPVEARVLAAVDHVFILSPALFEKKQKFNPHSVYLPGGVDFDAYSATLDEPKDLATIPHPRIGYVGSLKWQIDWNLLLYLTGQHSEWSFIFVGPLSPHPEIADALKELSSRRNVHFLGGKPSAEMIAYPRHFDVCIMPYGANDYTKYIYPLKLHEYLASGQPVVGTPIDSLKPYHGVILLPKTREEWSAAISESLGPVANTAERRVARRNLAKQHDWEILVQYIAGTIVHHLGPAFSERLTQHFQKQQEVMSMAEANPS